MAAIMSSDLHDGVAPSLQLQGKTNYVSWLRNFKKAAKAKDVWMFLDKKLLVEGTGPWLALEPKLEAYYAKVIPPGTNTRATTAKEGISKDDTALDGLSITSQLDNTLANHAFILWQTDIKKYEKQRTLKREAMHLLERWVSPGIAVEIEQFNGNPTNAYDYVTKKYKVSNDRVREITLEKLAALKLEDCDSMVDYLNLHRTYQEDLRLAEQVVTDGQQATAILTGLPPDYQDFKKQYAWVRAKDADGAHDLTFLIDRLLIEEEDIKRAEAEKKKSDKPKKEAKGKARDKTKDKVDKSHLLCTHCKKNGHLIDTCWDLNPDLKPKRLRNKKKSDDDDDKPNKGNSKKSDDKAKDNNIFNALASIDIDKFRALAQADSSGRK